MLLFCSCSPNARFDWNLASFTLVLRAHTPIREGEEITIAYVDPARTRDQRQEELRRRYRFECKCKACNRSAADVLKSDLRRLLISNRATEAGLASDEAAFRKWLIDGSPTVQSRDVCIWNLPEVLGAFDRLDGFARAKCLYSAMEQEYFHPDLWEPVLARLVKCYSLLEDEGPVRQYALTAAHLRSAHTGSDGGWAAVAEHPRQSDWWGSRRVGHECRTRH